MVPVLLIHGAAVTGACWGPLVARLDRVTVAAPTRPSSGSLDAELEFLAPLAEGALVVGVSGGATLAIALAASDVQLSGAIAHEPAAGSLEPTLLAPMVAALEAGGVDAFARELYGPQWRRDEALDDDAVRRDIGMFRAFEPQAPRAGQGPVVVTTGARSPDIRHRAATALRDRRGYPTETIPGAGHYVQKENPAAFAALVRATLAGISDGSD